MADASAINAIEELILRRRRLIEEIKKSRENMALKAGSSTRNGVRGYYLNPSIPRCMETSCYGMGS
ncbi:MAG: hypothetical protein GSR80_000019 [Desulfurococcales archaeon]|nr:hypothetical protein [Desulfurococcales archaeon]